ncbi:hypothetical protein D9756_000039 [Leucocoprinus leucothites]|uniref:Uncharacterized protein n=1 Tax=Leucocoprinus leucothites TaxID=201217 RepID=A0A8H5GE88_9AGAR|nr:hypothetical protein D9756_000039 [Leucoagaricus leucothites]
MMSLLMISPTPKTLIKQSILGQLYPFFLRYPVFVLSTFNIVAAAGSFCSDAVYPIKCRVTQVPPSLISRPSPGTVQSYGGYAVTSFNPPPVASASAAYFGQEPLFGASAFPSGVGLLGKGHTDSNSNSTIGYGELRADTGKSSAGGRGVREL